MLSNSLVFKMLVETDQNSEFLSLGRQIVVFIGPEGAGKTEVSERIAAIARKLRISTGDIIRDLAEHDQTEYGDECRAMRKEDRYLKPYMLLDILTNRFRQEDAAEGFILDGGLRTIEETNGFQIILEKANRVMPVTVVHLRIPGWMSYPRLVDGPDARRRDGDTLEGVLGRLSNFYKNLGQRTSFIRQQPGWKLLHVDATGSIDTTVMNVRGVLVK